MHESVLLIAVGNLILELQKNLSQLAAKYILRFISLDNVNNFSLAKRKLNGDVSSGPHQMFMIELSQLTFTCSKSAIEALEKGVKYVKS